MKIRQLQIERFGAWQDVAVALAPAGLTVLYGPNETGKSTLVRFIRGVLYGFQPQDGLSSGARPRISGCAGELHLTAGGDELIARRSSTTGGQAELLRFGAPSEDSTPTLSRYLGGITRDVYERVFAVGLAELQELSTLHGDEIAQFIYQTSLGNDGERVLTALQRATEARRALADSGRDPGAVRLCRQQIADIDAQLAECHVTEERLTELQRRRRELSERIEDQQWRQQGLRDQLRGHSFLERAYTPWQRQRRLHEELAALPDVTEFPEGGSRQLSELETELVELRRQRQRLRAELQRLRHELPAASNNAALLELTPEIRRLSRELEAQRGLESQLPGLKSRADVARRQLDERLRDLGPGWSEVRLERVTTDPAAAVRLFKQADRYRAAARSRARGIRAYRRLSKLWQQQQTELSASLRRYAGAGIRDAQDQVQQELDNLHELQRLEARYEAGARAVQELRADASARSGRNRLPQNFFPAVVLLGIAGACLAIAGVWRYFTGGGVQAAIVGAIFALLCICCGGLLWTIRQRLDVEQEDQDGLQQRLARAQAELDKLDVEMQQLIERPLVINDLESDDGLRIAGCDGVDDVSDVEQITERHATLVDQLAALSRAQQAETQLQQDRERLSRLRQRIRLLQRTVSQARRDWCTALKEVGLDESIRVAGALEIWQTAQEACRLRINLLAGRAAVHDADQSQARFAADVAAVAQQIECEPGNPAQLLEEWRTWIENDANAGSLRTSRLAELRRMRAALRELGRRRRRLSAARRELLSSVGARDRNEFDRFEAAWRRSGELQTALEEASRELEDVAASEPELAIVEDDLLRFDAPQNRAAIETIENELHDLQADLRADHEGSGRVQQEIAALESDRRFIELRFERAQAEQDLQDALQQWAAAELAGRALEALRTQIEADCQPQTLQSAGRCLQQLTAGKYQRVYAPLGEMSLVVEDEHRQSFRVDQLSSGTREQLFLAIRLALIDDFVRQGIELPVVLDDLFVNFDQQRTEAAVRTIVDFAADGRQVLLLTCHQHLVRLFETAGAAVVRLPEPMGVVDRRRVG